MTCSDPARNLDPTPTCGVLIASRADTVETSTHRDTLLERYARVRALSVELCATLEPEDMVVQTMPDVSPAKWHLAHVTWFFERFVLTSHTPTYRVFDDGFDFLFNSYYYTAGQMHARPERGLLSRPTVRRILAWREHVDAAMGDLIATRADDDELRFLVSVGLNHEQQHQELLLTDIKHVFWSHPHWPAVRPELPTPPSRPAGALRFVAFPGGVQRIGTDGELGFAFDNETPRHEVLLRPYALGSRLVTNGEYREFIADGGYAESSLWLSDGWARITADGWNRPWYWNEECTVEFTLAGPREIDDAAPVTHVSYYEADAFARWAGARLPTEAEWECAAAERRPAGNLLQSGYWTPVAGGGSGDEGLFQLYGDVWEWTASPYAPYPGFRPLAGSLGEYNGKFMCNQMVVRGGSCVTSDDHIRATYRSFFYPDARWQFLGLRLARDD